MTVPTSEQKQVRIPNLPYGQIVDDKGHATDDFLTFLQTLLTQLQLFFGNEGLVAPTQTATNIATIVGNQIPNPSNPSTSIYTCQFGTCWYNSTANSIQFAIDNGSGAPIQKTVTLT